MNKEQKNTILTEINAKIKLERISRTYISDETNISPGALSEFLNGKRDISWHKFSHLCQIIRYRIIEEAPEGQFHLINTNAEGLSLFWTGSLWSFIEANAQSLTYPEAKELNIKFDNQHRIISAW
jgi:transcriptional regulator with XRE-family HTH domain